MSDSSVWVQEVLAPQKEDSTDVRWAVETASAMWARGDRDLCLRWVHHAVQAATADGRHQRADDLDRAAQLLELSPLPSVVPQHHTSLGLAPATERVDSGGTSGASAGLTTAPYRVALDDITHLGAPDTGLLASAALRGGELSENTAAPVARRERPKPPSSPLDDESTVVNAGQKRPQERTVVMDVRTLAKAVASHAISAPSPSSSVDVVTTREYSASELLGALHAEAQPEPEAKGEDERRPPGSLPRVLQSPSSAVSSAGTPATLGSPAAPLEPLRAVRVAVARGTGRELAVRLLDDGETPPVGTQEAFLLALKP